MGVAAALIPTVYIFSGTKVIAEYVNTLLSKEYIYSGSSLLAKTALYYSRLSDHYGIPEVQAATAYNGGPYNYKNNPDAQNYQKAFDSLKTIFASLVNCMRQ